MKIKLAALSVFAFALSSCGGSTSETTSDVTNETRVVEELTVEEWCAKGEALPEDLTGEQIEEVILQTPSELGFTDDEIKIISAGYRDTLNVANGAMEDDEAGMEEALAELEIINETMGELGERYGEVIENTCL